MATGMQYCSFTCDLNCIILSLHDDVTRNAFKFCQNDIYTIDQNIIILKYHFSIFDQEKI